MKTKFSTLALGFVLGAAALMVMGQARPGETAGRYFMVQAANSVCVLDTATGRVKFINPSDLGQPATNPSQKIMRLGDAF